MNWEVDEGRLFEFLYLPVQILFSIPSTLRNLKLAKSKQMKWKTGECKNAN